MQISKFSLFQKGSLKSPQYQARTKSDKRKHQICISKSTPIDLPLYFNKAILCLILVVLSKYGSIHLISKIDLFNRSGSVNFEISVFIFLEPIGLFILATFGEQFTFITMLDTSGRVLFQYFEHKLNPDLRRNVMKYSSAVKMSCLTFFRK